MGSLTSAGVGEADERRLTMFSLFDRPTSPADLLNSKLYDQGTFYQAFIKDLANCHSEVIIECPFKSSAQNLAANLEKAKGS